jgi:hypothetical protein
VTARRGVAALAATALAALATLAAGCGSEAPVPTRAIEVRGEIRLPPGAELRGKVYVNLYHAWALQGELRHPLQLIESFEAAPGAFSHRLLYPQDPAGESEGLVVYAWADLDGDAVLCTPTVRGDVAGLAEVEGFPADAVNVTVDLTEPCRGPDWFYPRPAIPRP